MKSHASYTCTVTPVLAYADQKMFIYVQYHGAVLLETLVEKNVHRAEGRE